MMRQKVRQLQQEVQGTPKPSTSKMRPSTVSQKDSTESSAAWSMGRMGVRDRG